METQPFDIDAPILSRSPSPPGLALEPQFTEGLPKSPELLNSSGNWDKSEIMTKAQFFDDDVCENIKGNINYKK